MENRQSARPRGGVEARRDYGPMDITDDGDRSADVHDVGFAHEDLLCFLAYLA